AATRPRVRPRLRRSPWPAAYRSRIGRSRKDVVQPLIFCGQPRFEADSWRKPRSGARQRVVPVAITHVAFLHGVIAYVRSALRDPADEVEHLVHRHARTTTN